MTVLLIALAGGLGAAARFLLDSAIRSLPPTRLPWGTIVVNVSGSFLLGLLAGLVAGGLASADVRLVVGTGFLGGYTTFSTASIETVRLAEQGQRRAAVLNGLGTLVVTVAVAALGFGLGLAV